MSNESRIKARLTPWYYQPLIRLVKPLYQIMVWRRHQTAQQTDVPIANYQDERNSRFGYRYPAPPQLPAHFSTLAATSRVTATALSATPQQTYVGLSIWCHAVSLGETNTIAPMLQLLLQRGATIWLTNTTQTGFARAEILFSAAITSRQLVHTFVPVDAQTVVEKFVEHAQPNLALFVETELWATTLEVLAQRQIPSVLVNARLSQKSFKRYQKFAALSYSMMQNISLIIAQDDESAKRFRQLGAAAAKIRRADSLKWSSGQMPSASLEASVPVMPAFAQDPAALKRPIWVAGSTHAQEEQGLLQVQQRLIQQAALKNTLLIIVPRHPERFAAVASLLDASGLVVHRRSHAEHITLNTQVYLVNSMGELEQSYQLADVAFVGGSLVNVGGHNPIEASRLAKPVVMGPYTQSCQTLVTELGNVGALQVVSDPNNLTAAPKRVTGRVKGSVTAPLREGLLESLQAMVTQWLMHPDQAKQAGKRGQALVIQKQAAMSQQLAMIDTLLAKRPDTLVNA